MALQFLNDGVFEGNVTATGRLQVGDGTDGYFYKYADGNTGFAGGNLIINNDVLYYNNWATNQYHGEASGASHFFRGNALSGNNWKITTAGDFGVGTILPQYKLDVQGDLALTEGNEVYGLISPLQNRQGMQIAVGDPAYKTAPLVTFQGSDQKVGIGTTTPTSTLTISSDVGGDATWNKSGILIENTSTTTGEPTLAFRNAGTEGTGANYWFTGLNQSNIYKLAYGTSFTNGNTMLALSSTGALTLNAYTQGFLQTDANGNVSISGGGTLPGGPYLPLSAGSSYPLTGDLYVGTSTASTDRFIRAYYSDSSYTEVRGYGIISNRATSYYRPANDKTQVLAIGNDGNTWNYIRQNANYHTFGKDTSEWMRIDTSGNVGIGTTSPGAKLDVKNIPTSGNGAILNIGLDSNSPTRAKIGVENYNGVFSLYDSGNIEDVKITTNGNSWFNGGDVGIGIDDPQATLHVRSANNVTGSIEIEGGKATVTAIGEINSELNFGSRDASATGGIGGSIKSVTESTNGSTVGLAFYTANQQRTPVLEEAMRITKDGNVGIGTTSPQSKLHVSSGSGANGDCVLSIEADTDNAVETANPVLRLKQDGGLVTGTLSLTSNNDMALYNVYAGKLFLGVGNSTKMTIDPNGNVGIGTTTPGEKLTVSGNGRFSNGSEGTLTIKHNYGYNKPNWGIKLDGDTNTSGGYLSQYINQGGFALNQGGTYYGGGPHRTDANSTSYSSVAGVSGVLAFYTDASLTASTNFYPSERMRISASGNVGIGITSPSTKLNVNGDIKIEGTGALFLGGSGVVPDWQISASTNDITIANVGGNSGSVFFNNSYGVAFPRLTTTQINAMPASVLTQGLMAYNTTLNTICFYNGSSWQKVSHSNM